MSRRLFLVALAALLILVGTALLLPAIRQPLLGKLRGEKFIDGYPVSYWLLQADQPVADSQAVLRLGQSGPEAVPVLLRHALDKSNTESTLRNNAGKALIELGPSARIAVPELIDVIVKDGSNNISNKSPAYYTAKEVLGGLGPHAVDATSHLIPLLRSIHHSSDAAEILAAIGPGAKAAIPSLIQALELEGVTSDSFCGALASVGAGEEAVPAILNAFHKARFNSHLEQSLSKMHRAGVPVIPHAIKALGSAGARTRQGAAGVLQALGPEAREAIPTLENLTTMDQNEHVRDAAAEALKKIRGTPL